MHNKLFVADNALAITGGRNIGDRYFTRDPHSNFIDLDVVAAGEIVPRVVGVLRCLLEQPVRLSRSPRSPAPAQAEAALAAGRGERRSPTNAELAGARARCGQSCSLTWVPATVLADRPAKIASDDVRRTRNTIANNIAALMRSAKQELILISPYFIPGEDGHGDVPRSEWRKACIFAILTNSLASTDSPLVHIGYSRYRVALLKLGVELYEVRPKLGQRPRAFIRFAAPTPACMPRRW